MDTTLHTAIAKTKFRIVPLMLVLYVLAFLDRSNIGFAKETYMIDVGLSEEAFALGAGIFFLVYAFLGAPANLCMKKFGAKRWMCITTLAWGAISTCMGFADTEAKFLCVRMALGVAEAGFFPGMIYLATLWFPKEVRSGVMGLFYIGVPIAMIFGSPLSGALLEMHGFLGHAGWFWMFVIEGLLAVVAGVFVYFYLDDSPQKARFLDSNEKQALMQALANEEQSKTVSRLLDVVKIPALWGCALVYMIIQIGVYGYTFYLPTQIASILGSEVNFTSSLVTAIPWVASFIGTLAITAYADKVQKQHSIAIITLFLAAVGLLACVWFGAVMAIACLCLVAIGVIAVQPLYWIIPQGHLGGAALAGGIGLINAFGAFGSFLAPMIRTYANTAFASDKAGVLTLGALVLLGVFLLIVLQKRSSYE